MNPCLLPGDYIIATTFFKSLIYKKKLVILYDQTHLFVIKRVLTRYNKTHVSLQSDNVFSTSVFCSKPIEKKKILFSVIMVVRKKYVYTFIRFKEKLYKTLKNFFTLCNKI